jgi:hypothetical protein
MNRSFRVATQNARGRRHVQFVAAVAVLSGLASTGQAALMLHLDPNVTASQFGALGQTAVTGAGDLTRWISDVRSPTPGGAAYDDFIDAEGNEQSPTLVSHSNQGTVWSFDGTAQRMLLRRADTIVSLVGFQDGFGSAFDANTLTAIVVGRIAAGGTGTKYLFDMAEGNPTAANVGFGLRYNHSTSELQGYADQTPNTAISLAADDWFVATYVWNGPASTATLTIETENNGITSVTNNAASSALLASVSEMRIGTRTLGSSGSTRYFGNMGDLMIFNDVADHSHVASQLALDYGIRVPEPTMGWLLVLGALVGIGWRSIEKRLELTRTTC